MPAAALFIALLGQVVLPSALPADSGPLAFGARDARYAVLGLSEEQVRQYIAVETAFRKRLKSERDAMPRNDAAVGKVIREGVQALEAILTPAQRDIARQINIDYRLPEGMRHIRLMPSQWEPLMRINRRFDSLEQAAIEEMKGQKLPDTRRLNVIASDRKAAVLAILSAEQRAQIARG